MRYVRPFKKESSLFSAFLKGIISSFKACSKGRIGATSVKLLCLEGLFTGIPILKNEGTASVTICPLQASLRLCFKTRVRDLFKVCFSDHDF